jgi:hypothetical protein
LEAFAVPANRQPADQAGERCPLLSLSDLIQEATWELIKKFLKFSSNKHYSASPDPKGNLVPCNACPKRLFCDAEKCGGFSNIKKGTIDRSGPKTSTMLFGRWVETHDFDPVTLGSNEFTTSFKWAALRQSTA